MQIGVAAAYTDLVNPNAELLINVAMTEGADKAIERYEKINDKIDLNQLIKVLKKMRVLSHKTLSIHYNKGVNKRL